MKKKKTSDTDWDRLASMEDHDIDTSDIPELKDAFFEAAQLSVPVRKPISIRLDADAPD